MNMRNWPILGQWLKESDIQIGIKVGESLLARGYSPNTVRAYGEDASVATQEIGDIAGGYEAIGIIIAADRAEARQK